MQMEWTADFSNATADMDSIKAGMNPDVREQFHRFLSTCRADGIDVMLVYTPEYIEGQQFVRNRKEILQIYRRASAEFGVPFLDYSDSDMSTNRDWFYNSMHLNQAGSEAFTRQFAEDIRDWMTSSGE